jgi:hypothetical protein
MPLDEFVILRDGLVLPTPAYELVFQCLSLGIQFEVDGATLLVDGPVTSDLLQQLSRWKPHVLLALNHAASDRHLFDGSSIVVDEGRPMLEGVSA